MADQPPPSYNEIFASPSAPPAENPQLQQPQYPPLQQPQMPPVQHVIIVNQLRFGENPQTLICPSCHESTLSKLTYENNFVNHILALGCCMLGLCCGCCLIPYCIKSIKNVRHNCSKCGAFLGLHRFGRSSI